MAPPLLGGKVVEGGPNAVDPAALAKADQFVAGMTGSYLEAARSDLKALQAAFDRGQAHPAEITDTLANVFAISHVIKGQGGSFGYDLMTIIADRLCLYLEKFEGRYADANLQLVALHIDALQAVIGRNLKGDGDVEGRTLIDGLMKVSVKLAG